MKSFKRLLPDVLIERNRRRKKIRSVCEVIVLSLQPKIVRCPKYIYVCKNKTAVGTAVCQAAWLTYCYFSFFKDKHTIMGAQHTVYRLTGDGRSTERL